MKKIVIHTAFLILFICSSYSQEQFSVFFESNKYDVGKKELLKIEKWISENKSSKVVAINGYTDEDGTFGYNDTLAQKRVNFVYGLIKNRVPIRDDFKTRSFGELHKHSKIKAENRRATIYYLQEKDLEREDEILGIKKEAAEVKPKKEIVYPEKLIFENPDGSKSEYKLDREFMKKVGMAKKGDKIKIENLNFIINTFAVVKESRGKLYELLTVLQKNPKLNIEIHGHLCCMPYDRTDLSTQRAKAIYNFLVINNIDKERLSYKGFGSTKPIFPIPEKNEAESAANRRVEILIVSNEEE